MSFQFVAELGEALADGVLAHHGGFELGGDVLIDEVLCRGGP